MSQGRSKRKSSRTRRKSRDRSDSDSSNGSSFRRTRVSPTLKRPDGSDGSPTREKFKNNSIRLRARAEARRKKIKDSFAPLARPLPKPGKAGPGYKRIIVRSKNNNDSGMKIRSKFHAEEGAHRLRIENIKIGEASDLKNTIDTLPSVLDRQVKNVDLRKIDISLNGIGDADKLAIGLDELGDDGPDVSFSFVNNRNEEKVLGDGFKDIKDYLRTGEGRPEDSEIMKAIDDLMNDAQKAQERTQQSLNEIDNVTDLHQRIKSKITEAEQEAVNDTNKDFLNGLKLAVELETRREAVRLTSSKDQINEINTKIMDNFQNLISNNIVSPDFQSKALIMVGKITTLANAAKLTTSEIDSLFKQVQDYHPVTANEIMIGGEMTDFFKKYYSQENANKLDADTLDDLFRDEFSSALRRMFKRINKNDLPVGFLKKSFINKSTPEKNELVVQGFQPAEQQNLNKIEKWRLNTQLKKHSTIESFESLEGGTASDVYRVTTRGPIGKSGVKEGFAKKATSIGDEVNDGVDKLQFKSKEEGSKIILKEHPKLIARQVVASRLAERMGFDGIASEIFSKGPGGEIIGISGRVPGVAIKDVDIRKKIMHRNFDFENAVTQKSLAEIQLFDALIGQVDRHGGNIFIDPNTGKAYGIDGDLVLPRGINMIGKEKKHYNDDTALKGQFERGTNGELIYSSDLIDVEMRDKIRSISRDEIEGILRGRSSDPEKLNDDIAIHYALMRYNAILRKIDQMEGQGTLIKKWDKYTYQKAKKTGNLTIGDGLPQYTNYIARSVGEYEDAGDPMNGQSFQGL